MTKTSTPHPPARRLLGRPRSTASADAVLDAAYRICAEQGLRGASVNAIAAASGVSKMTIYKWWAGRLPLLVDAFLRQAAVALPLPQADAPVQALQEHVWGYARELQGEFGQVMLAVLAECLAEQGSTALFVDRYLAIRRGPVVALIRAAQRAGSLAAGRAPEDLYDQIYGTIFYRFLFGLGRLGRSDVKALVAAGLGELRNASE